MTELDGSNDRPSITTTDLAWALDLYGLFARGGEDEAMVYAVVGGAPWSKARPRFGSGRTYQRADDATAEAAMRTRLRALRAPMYTGNVMLACRFYRPNAQRIDTDNLIKHVCDSATSVLWEDDSQVTLTLGELLQDPDRPRTVIVVGAHESSLHRGTDREIPCAHCESDFVPRTGSQRYCSKRCSASARTTTLKERRCAQCAGTFQPVTRTQKLCSEECRRAFLVGRNQLSGRPNSTCAECGAQLAHHRGGRCRACWRANPRIYSRDDEWLDAEVLAERTGRAGAVEVGRG
jgi:Holliday junction resolvase RusA-like endonuclease